MNKAGERLLQYDNKMNVQYVHKMMYSMIIKG